jgi:RimJ/RimL family protein N-acetyltransferase
MYQLRVVEDTDLELVQRWLQQPYVAKWLGDSQEWMQELRGRNEEYHYIHHFIFEESQSGVAIGFAQYYDYQQLATVFRASTQPTGTYGIGYAIGNRSYLNKGLGSTIVQLIMDKVLEDQDNVTRIIADPTTEENKINEKSIAILEKNGFQLDQEAGLFIKNIKQNN